MAITLRGELPEQVIFHTNRGTQRLRTDRHVHRGQRTGPLDGLHRGVLGQGDGFTLHSLSMVGWKVVCRSEFPAV